MKNRNTRKREQAPMHKPRRKKVRIYWAESLQSKMLRWIKVGTHGARLAALGVPLDLMTDQQRQEASFLHGQRISPLPIDKLSQFIR